MIKQSIQESKHCECCGKAFFRRPRDSGSEWEARKFCSLSCNNRTRIPTPPHVRFWSYVQKDASGCWLWTGAKDSRGYGHLSRGAWISPYKAHRLSLEMVQGPIPDGMSVCHHCDVPSCVNPEHLFIGSQKDNMVDCGAKGRISEISRLNLRPGAPGFHGAGPISIRDKKDARNK